MFQKIGYYDPTEKVIYNYPVSWYAVYAITIGAFIIAAIIIVYQIRTGPKIGPNPPKKDLHDKR